MRMVMVMADAIALQMRMQAWLSPAFPIGAFSYSGGLEAAAAAGEATGVATLRDWLETYLELGPGWTDAVFLSLAARHARAGEWAELAEVSALAKVFAPGAERRLETRAQGAAFLKAARAAHPWPDPAGQEQAEAALGAEPAYPSVFGAWAGGHGAAAQAATALYLHAMLGNLISAGARLGLIGQTDGQILLAELGPPAARLAEAAVSAAPEAIGGAMIRGDLATMRHETQTVRLFRS